MKRFVFIVLFAAIYGSSFSQSQHSGTIQPIPDNPFFWQYHGQPVLLIGGSSNDNLFQNRDVVEELDKLVEAGGNYVRNSMSSMDDMDKQPFWRYGERYNLDKPNKEYWDALDHFLKLASGKDIIVQLEVWAYKDFIDGWVKNPWNPKNNNSFTEENTQLKNELTVHDKNGRNNFFMSVPKINNDSLLLNYQKLFVNQLLSVTLKYNNILYSITDHMSSEYSIEWGWFWANYINQVAKSKGITIEITEMLMQEEVMHEDNFALLNHPETYSFLDISQNSLSLNEAHWENLVNVRNALEKSPRPINNLQVVGGQLGEWTGGPAHGVERFWRNLIAGSAACRFEAEPLGLGISTRAQKQLKSASLLIKEYDFFSSVPNANFSLILEREEDEAYVASNAHKDVVVYFTDGGQIILDFTDFEGLYSLKWLNIEGANWCHESVIDGGGILELTCPYAGNWIALLSKL